MCQSFNADHFYIWNKDNLFDFTSTHVILTPVISIFWSVLYSELFSAVSSTLKISIKMFQIQQGIFWEYPQNFPGLPIHSFAHAKVQKSIFIKKILVLLGDFGIILNDFQSWLNSTIEIWVKFIWVENPKIPGIQPNDCSWQVSQILSF